jgi:di/tricarboxylate transporter
MVAPTVTASAFLNNTPIVAMLIPQVTTWAEGRSRSPSHYLMPLSFAAILGGVVTVIGTSTNLVVSGLLDQAGLGALGFFEIAAVGLPVALVGSLIVVALAPAVLPARRSVKSEVLDEGRRFVTHMIVVSGGVLEGKTVEAAGLRSLRAGFLATIERRGEPARPVTPTTTLRGGDRLRFVGRADQIVDLQAIKGLASAEMDQVSDLDTTPERYFEAVVGQGSPLAGRTLREVDFRRAYQAAVLAIHRSGHLVDAKLGSVPIQAADTLILLADRGFATRWRDRGDFLLVAPMGGAPPMTTRKAVWVGLITLGIVLAASTGLLPILQASLIGAVAIVLLGILTPSEARASVDLDVIIVIAAAFGVAAAVEASGLATTIASGIVALFEGFGPVGILAGVVVTTVVLTGMVSNNAAALLMFPIAVSTAIQAGLDPRGFAIAIAVAASADFLTPIGYQTNTMVYGPGGYRFGDYARLGAPLTAIVMVTILVVVPRFWPL